MREGWEDRRLGDICDLRAGEYIPKARYDDGPYVIYGSNSVMGRVSTPLIEQPHVVMAAVGANAGAVRFSPAPSWVNNNAFALIARPGAEPQFLYFWLEAVLRKASILAGTGQPYVKKGLLRDQKVALPPLDEQRRIVDLISSLDATITATDQAVVKAEQAHRAVLADLLSPSSASTPAGAKGDFAKPAMRDGWMAQPLLAIAGLAKRSRALKSDEYQEAGRLAVVDQGASLIAGYTDDASARVECESPVVVFGDHTCRIKYVDFPFAVGAEGTKVLVARSGVHPYWLYSALQAAPLRIQGYARHFSQLKRLVFLLPPIDEQLRIVEIVSALEGEGVALKATAKAARAARAGLLSDLLSGTHEIPASYDRLLDAP
jgi:type I restriction enzyme S subunit